MNTLSERRNILLVSVTKSITTMTGDPSVPESYLALLRAIESIMINKRIDLSLSAANPGSRVSYDRHYDNPSYVINQADQHRVSTTLGRFVKRQIDPTIPDHILAMFSESVMRNVRLHFDDVPDPTGKHFKIVTGPEVVTEYEIARKYSDSCMTGAKAHLTELYACNSGKVGLLILFDGGTRLARSLIWFVSETLHVVDRVFPSEYDSQFRDYAARCKIKTVTRFTPEYNAQGTLEICDLTVPPSGEYPYLDTFCYTDNDPDDEVISLNNYAGDYQLDSTEGYFGAKSENLVSCENCGARGDEENYFYSDDTGETLCGDCYHDSHFCCPACECIRTNEDECEVMDRNGDSLFLCSTCRERYYTRCDSCGEDHHFDNICQNDSGVFCGECAGEHYSCGKCGTFPDDSLNSDNLCRKCAETLPASIEMDLSEVA